MKRTAVVIIGMVVAIVAVLSGAVAVVLLNDGVDAETLLERATEFVDEQDGVHFEGRLTVEFADTEADETITTRTRMEGDTNFEDSRVVGQQGGFHTEVVQIGRMIYERNADSKAGLVDEKYAAFDLDEEAKRSGVVAPGDPGSEPSRAGEPATLRQLLKGAREPKIVSHDGGEYVLRADVSRAAFAGTDAEGTARLDLTVTDDGEVRSARIDVTSDEDDSHVVGLYDFSRWGRTVELAAPPAALIDPTPFIDEEDLAAWKDAPLLSPRSMPRGWILDGAYVVPEEETAEECEQVALDYTDPNDEEAGYLSLFQIPLACEGLDPDPPRGSAPLTVGRYTGWVDESEDGTFAQIVVGATVVQADTDLDIADLTAVLASLGQLDLEARTTPFGSGRGGSSA